jgi:phospholipase D1/2
VIVDAADYFAHAKAAMLKARQSIMLIGWDFDLRIRLTPDADGGDGRMRLGDFLRVLVRRRPELRIYILKWDMAVLFTMRWQIVPMILYDLLGTRRIHLRFDSTHPLTAAHHQKIVVIDDALAFCGGIDMTVHRWDTRGHTPGNVRRIDPSGRHYGPWHDSTAAVDGDAARALGDLARARWHFATGQRLPVPDACEAVWPESLPALVRNVRVAIARTHPEYQGRPAVHEIEALYLAAIRAARESIYFENQFFASQRIAEALIARLGEESGPEILVVNPRSAESWLEEQTMDSARTLLVRRLRAADRHSRFRIYEPVDTAGDPIYVHSKVMIVDDRLLRIGSSNIDNRSMGFDSECDLAIEATDPDTQLCIRNLRDDLLSEHLDVSREIVAEAIAAVGTVGGAVEALRKREGRSLRPLRLRPLDQAQVMLVESRLADPERPAKPERRLEHAIKRAALRYPVATAVGVAGLIAAIAVLRRQVRRRSG